MKKEEWKKARETAQVEYWISNRGRCRRIRKSDGYAVTSKGRLNEAVGYMYFDKDLVHRLVAQAFIPNPDGLEQVDHVNSDRLDNRVENLRWSSRKRNNSTEHANDMRRRNYRCTRHLNQIIKATKEGERDRFFKNGKAAARELGCSHVLIYNCLNGMLSAKRARGWRLEWVDLA